jgi:hypothetical protein
MKRHARWGALAGGVLAAALLSAVPAGCGGDDDDDGGGVETTLFPATYSDSYEEVRNCRRSSDHDLNYIRVVAAPDAVEPYQARDGATPFPTGAVVLKEEYDPSDDTCSGEIAQWTVMSKLAAGSSAETLDWHWQEVRADRKVNTDDEPRCIGCHESCGDSLPGFDATCADP